VADRGGPVLDGLVALLVGSFGYWSDLLPQVDRVQRAVRAYPELVPVLQERIAEFEAVLVDAVARRLGVAPDDERPQVAAAVAGTLLRICMTRPGGDGSLAVDLARAHAALRALL
jgi:hypothetical protein